MYKNSVDLIQIILRDISQNTLEGGLKGIEKESLRILDNMISPTKHPLSLGSSLCNRYITTDFSEAQLELVTPPIRGNQETHQFLDYIHHFINNNIEDEIMWPLSMPPIIKSENDIPIASYGHSDQALFKTTYRNGLSNRYGRVMQTISGIHFNYSLPETIWSYLFPQINNDEKKDIKSAMYFRGLRNLQRMNWLILYLFGASPIISKNFISDRYDFSKLNEDYYFLPHATSLRMSDLGYQNIHQSRLKVSLDSIYQYSNDLRDATEKSSDEFMKISINSIEDHPQINASLLQIEDEYYSGARPKSSLISDRRLTAELIENGVDYIELRSLDLNPFVKTGINLEAISFLEAFCIYCILKPSPLLSYKELEVNKANDLSVAVGGRDPKLKLDRDNSHLSIKEWGKEIIDEMLPIFELLDVDCSNISVINKILDDPKLTPSSKLMEVVSSKKDYFCFGSSLGEENKKYYKNLSKSENAIWETLSKESNNSLILEGKLKKSNTASYKKYMKQYYGS